MFRIFILLAFLISFVNVEAQSRKVVIDCDPGIDDAMALILALEYTELDILGITTVFGNSAIEQATENTLRIVELAQRDIPVYKGAAQPLVVPLRPPPDFVHGKDGLGNTGQQKSALQVEEKSAATFIVEIINTYPNEVTLLAVGRLTNLAKALLIDPGVAEKVKEVVLMGGALYVSGNVTPVAEANIFGDPHAADLVFRAGWPLTMIGLDVTTKLVMTDKILQAVQEKNKRYGDFIFNISRFYREFHIREEGVADGFFVHDPSAVMYLIAPELFELKEGPIRVQTDGMGIGQTIMAAFDYHRELPAWKDQPAVSAAIDVDDRAFFNAYLRQMTANH